jgi:Protein of unknown function (DUF3102)
LLIEAKGLVAHGDWLSWLEANCQIGPRQAQRFMLLARNRHKVEEATKTNPESFFSIAEAVALVSRPKPERPHGLPGQLDMLGGPPVPPPSATVPAASPVAERALFELIANMEQALAIIRVESGERGRRRLSPQKRNAALRAAGSTLATAIAYLKRRVR